MPLLTSVCLTVCLSVQLLDCDDERMVDWLKAVCEVGEQYARQCTGGLKEKAAVFLDK